MSNFLFLQAYDQPSGQSNRTFLFASRFASLEHSVTFITNNYCQHTGNFRVKHSNWLNPFFIRQSIEKVTVYWIRSPPYTTLIGRILNISINCISSFFISFLFCRRVNYIISPSVPLPLSLVGLALSRLLRSHFIYEIRDVWPYALYSLGLVKQNSILYKFLSAIEKASYLNSYSIISTLPAVAQHIKSVTGRDLGHKLAIIPNPVSDSAFIEPSQRSARIKASYTSNTLDIVYIGGFGYDHDIEFILRLAKYFHVKADTRFSFHLYGSGPYKSSAGQFISSECLFNIYINDPLPKPLIPKVLLNYDLAIASIKDVESFKFGVNLNKIGSYMAAAIPILYYGNAPNCPVSESHGGYSVRHGNFQQAIDDLYNFLSMPPIERETLSHNSFNYALKNFSISSLCSAYLSHVF